MERWVKRFKSRFGKGFTLMLVPNSVGEIKSIAIPCSWAIALLAVIIFNLAIFGGYLNRSYWAYRYQQRIYQNEKLIARLEHEQREVKPALAKSREIAAELNRIQREQEQIQRVLQSIQQKSGRYPVTASRGAFVRNPQPYPLNSTAQPEEIPDALAELKNNQKLLDNYIKKQTGGQRKLLDSLLAYERQLDHTPSLWPVYTRVNSWFGYRRHPLFGRYILHRGVDLQASYGTAVRAAAAGVIEFSGYRSGYGYTVIINHAYGYKTLYGHNSRLVAQVGQTVKKGQLICYSGNSGSSTGPHLHYEVLVGGSPVNPVGFLKN